MTRRTYWLALLLAVLSVGCQLPSTPPTVAPPATVPDRLKLPDVLQPTTSDVGKYPSLNHPPSKFALIALDKAEFLKEHENYGLRYRGHDGESHFLESAWDDTVYSTPRKELSNDAVREAIVAKQKWYREGGSGTISQPPQITRSKEWVDWNKNAKLTPLDKK